MEKTSSLKKGYDFSRVYKNGKYFASKYVVLYFIVNKYDENRIGIVVTKKNGNSVRRNRIRRLIKESYRLNEFRVKIGYDLVFVSRKNQNIPKFKEIKSEIEYILKRLSLLK
ncbi:MAG: ribonuclease P protein component [Clostridiales bacterium]